MKKYRVIVRYTPHTRFFKPQEKEFEVINMKDLEKLCYDVWGETAWAKNNTSLGGCSIISVREIED